MLTLEGFNDPPAFTKGKGKKNAVLESPSKVTKTGRHLTIPISKKANLDTPAGLALVIQALTKAQGELAEEVGKTKKNMEVPDVYKVEDSDEEE